MLGRDVLDLPLTEGGTREYLVVDQCVVVQHKVHQLEPCLSCDALKGTGQGHVLLDDPLEVQCRIDNFVAPTRVSLVASTRRY